MKWFKRISILVGVLVIASTFSLTALLYASLPKLDDDVQTSFISFNTDLQRDIKGMAVINAQDQYDASFALGFAHAQDRLFQMDLLRRQAAGELSELVGERALAVDKKYIIHQFRERASSIFSNLQEHERKLLTSYTNGVNQAVSLLRAKPPEYYLLNKKFAPWSEVDSLLAIFSMYIDLQSNQIEIDFAYEALKTIYGEQMHAFFNLPSNYQSSIDRSVIPKIETAFIPPPIPLKTLPSLPETATHKNSETHQLSVTELPDIGSNNWVVSGKLTHGKSAMLSNDMHLGLAVPSIWYKAQLNYKERGNDIQVTGVSLPGTPAIIVGSTNNLAWGFTNSGIDNVDWIKLSPDSETYQQTKVIKTGDLEKPFSFEMSEFGPVREFLGRKYALKWVAHEPYAINLQVTNLASADSVDKGIKIAKGVRIPAQNLVLADSDGNIGWQLTGAITARKEPKRHALQEYEFSELWKQSEPDPPSRINPDYDRLWTANARVVSTIDDKRFGNGGYALGARQLQIEQRLFEKLKFSEQDFYKLQLDNEARFLIPWHGLLLSSLNNLPDKYSSDINFLINWGQCACPDSVGYSLVRKFRSAVISTLLAPITETLKQHSINSKYLLRNFETSVWHIINQKDPKWLTSNVASYDELFIEAYQHARNELTKHLDLNNQNPTLSNEDIKWGQVNKLKVTHPFASALGPFSNLLNMPEVDGFGDSYMPAVQTSRFGASQRFIVRPGNLNEAILTIPGGQSGHFLSQYYDSYFEEYADNKSTKLLPLDIEHSINFVKN